MQSVSTHQHAIGELPNLSIADSNYDRLLVRLNRASITKYYRAYEDIAWDDPEYRIDPTDPRFIMADSTLMQTRWAQAQPEVTRARIGLHMMTAFMKLGAQFENVLSRGLLEFALTLPNGSPEFRYAYHEVIEESQHSLMFQEFVNRSGLQVSGLPAIVERMSRNVVGLGRGFPELFFIFVLGGEDPIDYQQRQQLKRPATELHPLARRISQIHVTEEARHISFASSYLRKHVPQLSKMRMLWLRMTAPFLLRVMSAMMMRPSAAIVREYGIPRQALTEAYSSNQAYRAQVIAAISRLAQLCRETGILVKPFDTLWRRLGLIA